MLPRYYPASSLSYYASLRREGLSGKCCVLSVVWGDQGRRCAKAKQGRAAVSPRSGCVPKLLQEQYKCRRRLPSKECRGLKIEDRGLRNDWPSGDAPSGGLRRRIASLPRLATRMELPFPSSHARRSYRGGQHREREHCSYLSRVGRDRPRHSLISVLSD